MIKGSECKGFANEPVFRVILKFKLVGGKAGALCFRQTHHVLYVASRSLLFLICLVYIMPFFNFLVFSKASESYELVSHRFFFQLSNTNLYQAFIRSVHKCVYNFSVY